MRQREDWLTKTSPGLWTAHNLRLTNFQQFANKDTFPIVLLLTNDAETTPTVNISFKKMKPRRNEAHGEKKRSDYWIYSTTFVLFVSFVVKFFFLKSIDARNAGELS